MLISQLVKMLHSTEMSPEELAPRLGVSNMTYRRWLKRASRQRIPKKYEVGVREGVYQLISEGGLSGQAPEVTLFMQDFNPLFFQAAIQNLGVPEEFKCLNSCHEDQIMLGLSKIGSSATKQREVNRSLKLIKAFEKFGAEWKSRIVAMVKVIQSKQLTLVDKLVAYGALFYLITPFDLIPDQIPVIGYIDDFAILGFAMAYYIKKFPTVVSTGK
jgi:uncharacterized membrane protein YkvA (DUF1232 family)